MKLKWNPKILQDHMDKYYISYHDNIKFEIYKFQFSNKYKVEITITEKFTANNSFDDAKAVCENWLEEKMARMDKQELVGKMYDMKARISELEAENAELKAKAQEVCEWKQVKKEGCDVTYWMECGGCTTVKQYDFVYNYCPICGRKIKEIKAGEESG